MSSAEQPDDSQEENDGKTDNHKDRTLRRAGRRMLRRYCFRFRLFRFFAGKVSVGFRRRGFFRRQKTHLPQRCSLALPYNFKLFELVKNTGRPRIPDQQLPLQHGCAGASGADHEPRGVFRKLVEAGKVERKISVITNNRRRGLRRLCGKALRFCSGRLSPGTSLFHIADARPGNGGGCPNAPVRHFCNPQPFDADARAET